MIHKCLGCRGLANAGSLPKDGLWAWKLAVLRGEADYHLVRLSREVRRLACGVAIWDAETACGREYLEEVHDEDA